MTNIFNFLQFDRGANPEGDREADRGYGSEIDLQGDGAAQVADLAFKHNHSIAVKAMDLFVEIYGAYAGNLALTGLTRGGVYVAGGIAPKIIDKLREARLYKGIPEQGTFYVLNGRDPGACGDEPEGWAAGSCAGSAANAENEAMPDNTGGVEL